MYCLHTRKRVPVCLCLPCCMPGTVYHCQPTVQAKALPAVPVDIVLEAMLRRCQEPHPSKASCSKW